MNKKLKVLEVSSNPIERGLQIGEENAFLIKEFVSMVHENYRELCGGILEIEEVREHLGKCLDISQKFAPDLYIELEGIAKASNVAIDDIIFINSFLELINFRFPKTCKEIFGCTSLGVANDNEDNKKVYVAQNYDMEKYYKDYITLIKIKERETDTLLITFAGVLGCIGFNSCGIGLNINYLQANDLGTGILYPFVVRKALQQNRIGDALGAITTGFKASGMNYLLSDSLGNIFDIEMAGKDFDILQMKDGFMSHSNHYKSEKLIKKDMMAYDLSLDSSFSRRGSTIIREHVCNKLLNKRKESFVLEDIKNILTDHTNYPYSICKHGDLNEDKYRGNETVFSSIFDLESREAHIAIGTPCKSDYFKYKL
ncbi:C45 family autoproteolytic acyltransferase/hydolase [Clostridium cellulovorans]|uniref:Peptidase C45 acyl-coenzyme A:6-aminopenicillanic acid acyl-transferase n=1 Tax=Clostridium cellulovorans (strain ATCC 35296 / DSM 3052 / OCM 3 / 743B) TaxID=573061 RepID=D9SU70_CLOC7|nr:C45 family peptidase [Clostridium cellulovorans]ADL52825.1 peptidase C45 acyl-coenzyme A:6-aminopenicillanic acid acyl-transferase [Clostridium cellulovorans 743B]